jgi:hypothetical protein
MAHSRVRRERHQRGSFTLPLVALAIGLALAMAHLVDLGSAIATEKTIDFSGPDELGRGLQDHYRLTLSEPAPAEGLVAELRTTNPLDCLLAPTEHTVGQPTLDLTVPAGDRRRTFVIQSLPGSATGCTVELEATTPAGWSASPFSVVIEDGKLRIRELVRTIGNRARNDAFLVQTGVPGSGNSLRFIQGLSKGTGPLAVKVCSQQPVIATIVDGQGMDNPPGVGDPPGEGCEDIEIAAPFSRTVPGDLQLDPDPDEINASGDATLRATAPGFDEDVRTVTVRPSSVSIRGADDLGEGLQDEYLVVLSDPAGPGGQVVQICGAPTSTCGVAITAHSLGTDCIERTVSQGRYRAEFTAQGIAIGTCELSAAAGAFGSTTKDVEVVQPALRIRELPVSIGQFARNREFFVELGVPGERRVLRHVQQWRKGLVSEAPRANLEVRAKSDAMAIGTIVDRLGIDNNGDGQETVEVRPGFSRTVPGDLQFDPIQGSETPVLVTAETPAASFLDHDKEVRVRAATLEITGEHEIGARLQDDYTVHLRSASGHSATELTIESLTPTVCLVSVSAHTAPVVDLMGQNQIVRNIGEDESSTDFVVHALDDQAGAKCEVEARADTYDPSKKEIDVVEAGIQIRELRRSIPATSPGDGFFVEVGVPNSQGTALRAVQRVRKGTTDVPVKVCSTVPDVGIITKLGTDNPAAPDDPPGQSCEDDVIRQAFSRNVPNDLKFIPSEPDSTIVEVSAGGFAPMERTGRVDIDVGGPAARLHVPEQVGSNLQAEAEVELTEPAGNGGVQVTLTSSNTDYCRLAELPAQEGSASPLVLTIAQGNDSATFVVAGQGEIDGVGCTIKAVVSGYTDDEAEVTVVTPSLQIEDLDRRHGSNAPSGAFKVQIGVPGRHDHQLHEPQAVRIDDTFALDVKVIVCTDDSTVFDLTDGVAEPVVPDPQNPNKECRSKLIVEGQSEVEFAYAIGVMGRTVVTADADGVDMTDRATRRIRVAQAVARLRGPERLGWNLQDEYTLEVSNSGGATLRVETSTPDVCRVSTDPSILGGDVPDNYIELIVPPGKRSAIFVVQALAQQSSVGTCTLAISGAGFELSTENIELRPARLRIRSLPARIGSQANNERFYVEIGVANPRIDEVSTNRQNTGSILRAQAIRAGAGERVVEVCSEDADVGKIRDPQPPHATAACADSPIDEGQSRSADFEFDPGDDGETTVEADVPLDTDIEATRVKVRVNPAVLDIRGENVVGDRLQEAFRIVLGRKAAGEVTVTVEAEPDDLCKVAEIDGTPGASNPPKTSVQVSVAEGERTAEFLVLGVAVSTTAKCRLTATATGYDEGDKEVEIRPSTFKIADLDQALSTFDDPDGFEIRTGVDDDGQFVWQAVQLSTDVKACVDQPTVGLLEGGAEDNEPGNDNCRVVTVPDAADANGDLSLRPVGPSPPEVCIELTADGFEPISKCVEVSAARIRIRGPEVLGAGLQQSYTLVLGHKATQALTIEVCVEPNDDDQTCEVALLRTDDGADCVDVPVAADKREGTFWVQGIEGKVGDCLLRANPDGNTQYTEGSKTIGIVTPAFQIAGLPQRHSATDPPDNFRVEIGVPDRNHRRLAAVQELRSNERLGAVEYVNPVVCSSDPSVGVILGGMDDLVDPDHCRKGTISQRRSSTSELSFDPLHDGDTFVDVREVDGYERTDAATVHAKVGSNFLVLDSPDVGEGLQDFAEVRLSRVAGAGGVQVTIESETPDDCRVAPDAFTEAAQSTVVTISEGTREADFVVAGVEGRANTQCTLVARAPSFIRDTIVIGVVEFGVQIVDLERARVTTDLTPDLFQVELGIPAKRVRRVQAVRVNGVAVAVNVTSSNPSVGTFGGNATAGGLVQPENAAATFEFDITGESGSTTVTATGGSGRDSVVVRVAATTVKLVGARSIGGRDLIGKGLQQEYGIAVSHRNGLTVTVSVDNTPGGTCYLSPSSSVLGGEGEETVVIPPGENRGRIFVQGIEYGRCLVTVSGAGFPDFTRDIEVTLARLRLRSLPTRISAFAANRPFRVEIGAANPNIEAVDTNRDNYYSLVEPQTVHPGVPDGEVPVTVCSSNDKSGKIVEPVTGDVGPCGEAAIGVGQSETAEFQLDPVDDDPYDDNITSISATAPGVEPTRFKVRVSVTGLEIDGPEFLGQGLQDTYDVVLGATAGSPVPVTVTAKPDTVCTLVGGTPITDGTQLVVTVDEGKRRAEFALRGVASNPYSPCQVTAIAQGAEPGEKEVVVVTPALRIFRLDREVSTFDDSDPFDVQTGAHDPERPSRFDQQAVVDLTEVTACVDDTAKGEIEGGDEVPDEANCRQDDIAAGADITRAFKLRPKAEPRVCVAVSAPGFDSHEVCVDINASNIRIRGPEVVGAGLQDRFSLTLGHKATADLTVRVSVVDDSLGRCEVALEENQNGADFVDVPIGTDRRTNTFWVQGVEGEMGECALEADAGAQYRKGHRSIDIATPAFQISGLKSRFGTFDDDDAFLVEIGVTNDRLRGLVDVQELRFNTRMGAVEKVEPVVCSSNTSAGEVIGGVQDTVDPDHCRVGEIAQLERSTAQFKFDPKNAGDTEVFVREVDGYIPTDAASVHVIVNDLNLSADGPELLGVGLQDQYTVRLGKRVSSDVDVTVKAKDSNCRVAVDAFGANEGEIHVLILKGDRVGRFHARGIAEGSCELEASASGFKTDAEIVGVQAPALAIAELPRTQTVGNPDKRFLVRIGVPDRARRGLRFEQPLSNLGSGQLIEGCSSETAYGTIVGGAAHPDVLKTNCRSTTMAAGESETDAFLFHPVALGDTVVTVGCITPTGEPADNCDTVDAGSREIHVSQAGISISGPALLGAGLQDDYAAVLGKAAPVGGVNVIVRTETPSRCKVANSFAEDGIEELPPIFVAKGRSRAEFVVQGVLGEMGECRIAATATNYVDGEKVIDVRSPALGILNLSRNHGSQDGDDPFRVKVAIPTDNGSCVRRLCQPVAINGGLLVNACSSDPGVGAIKGGVASGTGCRETYVARGQCLTDAFSFDSITAGDTVVEVTSPAIAERVDCDDIPIHITNAALSIVGTDTIGIDLQDSFRVVFSKAPPDNSTVTIDFSGPCTVSESESGPPVPPPPTPQQLSLIVPPSRTRVDFWVQGLAPGGACEINVATNAYGYNPDSLLIGIVTPAVRLRDLDGTRSTAARDDQFFVDIGVPKGNRSNLESVQEVRPHSASYPLPFVNGEYGVPLKVCSSNTAVGTIVGGTASANCSKGTIEQLRTNIDIFAFRSGTTPDVTEVFVAEDGVALDLTAAASKEVQVAADAVRITGPDALGAGLQDGYRVVLSRGAQATGTVTLESLRPEVCLVSASEATEGGQYAYVTIAAGRSGADFAIQALEGVEDTCDVRATTDANIGNFVPAERSISVVQPGLRIINLDTSRSASSADDPFNVEIGVPRSSGTTLATVQAARKRTSGGGVSVTVCSSFKNVGTVVGATGDPACRSANIDSGKSRTADGVLKFDAIGNETTTKTTTIYATATGFLATDAASKDVVVSNTITTINGPDELGATLEDQYTLVLSKAVSTATTFSISSTTTSLCKLSVTETALGIDSIDVTVPANRAKAYFFVHGMDITGTCELTTSTSASGISPAFRQIEVVTPGIRIQDLAGSLKTSSADDNFIVQTGVPSASLRTLSVVQKRRSSSGSLTVTACSSDATKAKIKTSADLAACGSALVGSNKDQTAASDLALRPELGGSTTVTATAPGFVSTDAASKDVTISQSTINITAPGSVSAIGAGLQDTFTVKLSTRAPSGGLQVTVTSLTPSVCLAAKDEATPGIASAPYAHVVTVAGGHYSKNFAIQALEGVDAPCRVSAAATTGQYSSDEFEINVRAAGLRIRSLASTTAGTSANDSFFIDVGIPKDNLSDLRWVQTVRAGAPQPLTVEACSSEEGVGLIATPTPPAAKCKSATIAANSSATATNAVQFDPVWIGTGTGATTVDARATGLVTTDTGSVDVVVTGVALSFDDTGVDRVGAGLMETFKVKSSKDVSSDTNVTVTSLTPTTCQVAVDETTNPLNEVIVVLKAGYQSKAFSIHGVEDAQGACQLRATAATMTEGYASYDVVPAALRIRNLSSSKTISSSNDAFNVDVGIAKTDLTTLDATQKVRTGSAGKVITVCSSSPTVGAVINGPPAGEGCATTTILASKYTDATLKFDTGVGGQTTVEATAPNHITTDAGSVDVTVTGSGSLAVISGVNAVGAGLQDGSFLVRAGSATTGTVTVTVTTLTPAACLVASSGTSTGDTTVQVSIPASATDSNAFWVQGLENVVAACQLQATALTGYLPGSGGTDIVRPALRISGLLASQIYSGANDNFNVQIGTAKSDQSDLEVVQAARWGGPGFDFTIWHSNPPVADLTSTIPPSPAEQVTGRINPASSISAEGQLQFDPVAEGGTSVSASHPSFNTTTAGTVSVAIGSGGGGGC